MDRMKRDHDGEELPRELAAAWKVVEARAAGRAARVDVERVAAQVLERLSRGEVEAPRRLRWMSPVVLRAAAAVVVVVAGAVIANVATDHVQQATALRLPVAIPAMDSLSSGQLEAVLEAAGDLNPAADSLLPVSGTGGGSGIGTAGASLDDLNESQLETLLASLNGAES